MKNLFTCASRSIVFPSQGENGEHRLTVISNCKPDLIYYIMVVFQNDHCCHQTCDIIIDKETFSVNNGELE